MLQERIQQSLQFHWLLGKDDQEVKTIPLSKETIIRRKDEMSENVMNEFIKELKSQEF